MDIKSYRDLRVWQSAMNLVEAIYRLTVNFPRQEIFNLTSGLRKSAVAVPSKIAAGHSSEGVKDYLSYLNQAQTVLSDMATQVEVAGRLSYMTPADAGAAIEQSESLGRQLYASRNSLRNL